MRRFSSNLGAWGQIGLVAISLLGTVGGALAWSMHDTAEKATAAAKLAAVDKTSEDHEARVRTLEAALGTLSGKLDVVQTDVRWIREYFDPEKKKPGRAREGQQASR